MSERPIIFSGDSVRAILDGRKTQTRRALKTDLPFDAPARFAPCDHPEGYGFFDTDERWHRCPFGRPGDRLWVREAFHWSGFTEDGEVGVRYVADEAHSGLLAPDDAWLGRSFEGAWVRWSEDMEAAGYTANPDDGFFEWTRADRAEPTFVGRRVAPMFLPRWASRITLEVASVRVERLQTITEADAKAEGVAPGETTDGDLSHALGFIDTWDRLNAKRGHGWDENPWVWVVGFKRTEDER